MALAEYLEVNWNAASKGEACAWYSEIDGDRRAIRKVVEFRDGRWEWADKASGTDYTWLAPEPLPSFDDIAVQDEFEPLVISWDHFRISGGGQSPNNGKPPHRHALRSCHLPRVAGEYKVSYTSPLVGRGTVRSWANGGGGLNS